MHVATVTHPIPRPDGYAARSNDGGTVDSTALTPAGATLVATGVLTPLAILVLGRAGVLDVPSARSSHDLPTVRGAGIAPAVAVIAVAAVAGETLGDARPGLVAGALGFTALGFAEDVRGVATPRRLFGQMVLAAIAVALLEVEGLWLVPAVLFVVSYVNAFNFMDGINGISALQAIGAGVAYAVFGVGVDASALTIGGVLLAAAGLGFLPFNFPRARAFLGDAGSYFFGAWCALLLVVSLQAGLAPEAAFAPLALYLADTGVTLVQRIVRREPFSQPHRRHRYQQLVQLGASHVQVSLVVGAGIAACALLGAAAMTGGSVRVLADLGILAVIAGYLASPHLWGASLRSRSVSA